MNNGGDVLARGGRSAQFGGPSNVSQKTWDDIWKDYEPEIEYEKKKEDEESFFTSLLKR
jgi:hypothetical protein